MSYDDLARLTGLTRRTLWNITSGSNKTRKGRAKVAAALGVNLWPRESDSQSDGDFQTDNETPVNVAVSNAHREKSQ